MYVVNEAQGLRVDGARQLLVMLERLPSHVAFVLTAMEAPKRGATFAALLSRCVCFKRVGPEEPMLGLAEAFAARAREIATREGLNGKPMQAYVEMVRARDCNLRAVLQAIQGGEMLG